MSTLIVTNAGASAENQAIAGSTPLAPIKHLVIGDGLPPEDPADYKLLTSVVHEVFRTPVLVVKHLSPTVMQFTGTTPVNEEFRIREIGVELEDGTLFAYTPYMLADGGLWKGTGLAWTFEVHLSREQGNSTLTVMYNPINVNEIRDDLVEDVQAQLDLYLQGDLLNYASYFSKNNQAVFRMQHQINQLKQQVEGVAA